MMHRDHEELRGLLPEYLLGTLDPASAEEVRDALARSPRLSEELRTLINALYTLPEALDPAPVPTAAWERIREGAHALADVGDRTGAWPSLTPDGDGALEPGPGGAAQARGSSGTSTPGSGEPDRRRRQLHYSGPQPARRARRMPRRIGFGLVAALAAALLATTGLWALHASSRADRLEREQQVIAYWLRRPDLTILPLQPVAGGEVPNWTGATEVPAGVVCLLPDGRAMLLQPSPAPAGTRYVLYGDMARGRVELGQTRQRFLLFDHRGLSGVTLAVEGRRNGTVARTRF